MFVFGRILEFGLIIIRICCIIQNIQKILTGDCVMQYIFSKDNMRDIEPITLGKQLRLLRQYNRLRQHEVAEALGVDRSTYAYYELDRTRPDYETLLRISDLYDVSLRFLLGQSDT